jgi:hypothetical protein
MRITDRIAFDARPAVTVGACLMVVLSVYAGIASGPTPREARPGVTNVAAQLKIEDPWPDPPVAPAVWS